MVTVTIWYNIFPKTTKKNEAQVLSTNIVKKICIFRLFIIDQNREGNYHLTGDNEPNHQSAYTTAEKLTS